MKTLKLAIALLVWLGWLTFALVFGKSVKVLLDIPALIVFIILAVLSMILSILEMNFND